MFRQPPGLGTLLYRGFGGKQEEVPMWANLIDQTKVWAAGDNFAFAAGGQDQHSKWLQNLLQSLEDGSAGASATAKPESTTVGGTPMTSVYGPGDASPGFSAGPYTGRYPTQGAAYGAPPRRVTPGYGSTGYGQQMIY
jgi:hypothetical protein